MDIPLLKIPYEDWYCPNCGLTDRVQKLPPNASRFHTCPKLHMLTAPLVRADVRAAVVAEERQEYLGREIQATGDDGIPYMAVRTIRDDGDDVAVNAGLAQARLSDYR